MAIKITILGLGQVGGSIGLALAQYKNKLTVVGHDKDSSKERAALKKGAVETTEHNLPKAVTGAQIVILAMPVHQVRETLEFIAQDLMDGAIVVDTSPVKAGVKKWVKEHLPARCNFVGLVPTLGADALQETKPGLDSARADLFSKSIFMLDAPTGTSGEAIDLTMDLVRLLGATCMLTDTTESDGLISSVYLLPQLVSAALVNATVDLPGWQEGRKLAERAFVATTSGLTTQEDTDSLQMLSLHNKENVVRSINTMILSLQALRNDIEKGDEEALKVRLEAAKINREIWMNERISAKWENMEVQMEAPPSLGERLFGGLFTGRPKK